MDKDFYLKILRYEPIKFDAFIDLAREAEIKIGQTKLRNFLDSQSITFYTQDPSSGPRRRY